MVKQGIVTIIIVLLFGSLSGSTEQSKDVTPYQIAMWRVENTVSMNVHVHKMVYQGCELFVASTYQGVAITTGRGCK